MAPTLYGVWRSLAPPKVEIFIWLAILYRLNTKDTLLHKGIIDVSFSKWPLCKLEVEYVNHLFVLCLFARAIWYGLANWWGVLWIFPLSLCDLFTQWEEIVLGSFQKKVWMVLFFSALWTLWLERNNVVFNTVSFNVIKTFFLIIHRA